MVNTHRVAKERHLYSFMDETGGYNTTIEAALAEVEEEAKPVIGKLNHPTENLQVTAEEKARLVRFVS